MVDFRIFIFISACFASGAHGGQAFVETYWETWVFKDYPGDYCAQLKEVPASSIGSFSGANYVNIAFADYSDGLAGIECDDWIVREGIEAVHAAGGKVKVAYGGALYSMSLHVHDQEDANRFCESVVQMRNEYNVDGIDLDIEDGGSSADLQVYLLQKCRQLLGPDFLITYTIPALVGETEPWSGTLGGGHQYLDFVNIMAYDIYWEGYDISMDINALNAHGIPNSKIVWGIMPGKHDAGNEYTSLEEAERVANYVRDNGLAGVMTWDINRDCDQRMYHGPGDDNLYQTGKPRASYVNLLSNVLNR